MLASAEQSAIMLRYEHIATCKTRACLLVACLAACGPTSESASDASSDPRRADAATPNPTADAMIAVDAQAANCPDGLPSDFGVLGQAQTNKNNISGHYNVFTDLQNNERWFFAMNFYPERGIFANGVVPGTYVLEGDDLDLQTCALCINLFADQDSTPGGPSVHMVPTQARVTISSVVGDEVSGRLEEVAFTAIKVTYDGMSCNEIEDPICINTICLSNQCGQQTPLAGCTTAIGSMEF